MQLVFNLVIGSVIGIVVMVLYSLFIAQVNFIKKQLYHKRIVAINKAIEESASQDEIRALIKALRSE